MDHGAVVFMGLPIAEYGQGGKLAQGIMRYCFQTNALRRSVNECTRPIFFNGDEFQHFLTSHEQIFQTTCRSARIATVYLTQNIPNIVAALGGGSLAKAQCDSLIANMNTKLFFCNSCSTTNEYAANLVGRTRQFMLNAGQSHSASHWVDSLAGFGGSPPTNNAGMSEVWEYEIQPSAFTTLKTGGFANKGHIETIVVRSGRPFADTGCLWRLVNYQQNLRAKPF
jgi:hypothetical protein